MTVKTQRSQILESLAFLDQTEAEKVLNYIKGLRSANDATYQRTKREAMIEIRQALSKGRLRNPGF
jgi:hypothetical protein